jgi:site-specific recombinase XerD
MPKMLAKVIETFSNEQIKALLLSCEKEYNQTLMVRDCAIIYILYDIGIRASELCGLTLDNVYLQPDDAYLKVLGKGDKRREVGLGKEARIALHRYISGYRKVGPTERYVFISRQGNSLTINGLEQLTYRLGRWARVKGVRCSPHTFRHTFAVNYLRATGDIYKLSRIMGHSSVKVTEGYLKSVKNKEIRNSIFVADTL